MDDSSFGGIYDAFDSFEWQMEEGLADINEDDPPSVAVAASATQSFQSIIGCDFTRIFLDNTKKKKPKKTGLSFDDKNAIAVPRWSLDRFQYT